MAPRTCSIARALDVVGERWALLAVREVFLGTYRFDEMVRHTGAPRDTLAARLKSLVEAGILERRPYSEHPPRHEYRLTAAGRELYPVILGLLRWGDEHLAGDEGPPLILTHRGEHRLVPQLTCQECGEPVEPRDVQPAGREDGSGSALSSAPTAGAPGHRPAHAATRRATATPSGSARAEAGRTARGAG